MWGDWDFWKHGFWGEINSTESGSRFDAMAASVCQAASNMGIRVIWLRSAGLRHMELTSDRWHFRSSAREHLQIILQAIFPDVPLPTASPTGCMASLLESCVDPLDMWRNGDIVEVPTTMAGYTNPNIRHVSWPCWKRSSAKVSSTSFGSFMRGALHMDGSAGTGHMRPWTLKCNGAHMYICVKRISPSIPNIMSPDLTSSDRTCSTSMAGFGWICGGAQVSTWR